MKNLKNRVIEILESRGKETVKTLADLPPINSLLNVVPATKFLAKLLRQGKRVLIVGDYDADGIMATSILYGFLTEIGFTKEFVNYIIPSRLVDGYGLSKNIIEYALNEGYEVIVTVDNGIAATEAIAYAKEKGLIVIVTDHHTAPAILPNADYIVNPKQPGETFPFIDISGATVAWYFVAALREVFDAQIDIRKYLDFVAITVVSDVMPLSNINVAILNYGLAKIKRRERYVYSLLWNDWSIPTINETSLGFALVPMINAIGRIADANVGVELFLSKDIEFIENTFEYIQGINEDRKAMTRGFLENAEEMMQLDFDVTQKVVIVRNKDYHEGIVGIIAGKLAEIHKRPAYVFSWNKEKEIWKGSARSTGEIHLYNLTNLAKEYILGFGGHKGAVGLAVTEDNWDSFKKTMEKNALLIPEEDFLDSSKETILSSIEDFDLDLLNTISSYGPFGEANPPLLFETEVSIKVEKELKGGLHYKCRVVSENGVTLTALFFNVKKHIFLEQVKADKVRISFTPTRNYNAKTKAFGFDLFCNVIND